VMCNARHLFYGPLRKCSKTTNHNRMSLSWSSLPSSSSVLHERCVATRMFSSSDSSLSTGSKILESPFGSVGSIDLTLPEYIWRNVEQWEDKPMIVSYQIHHSLSHEHNITILLTYFYKLGIIGIL